MGSPPLRQRAWEGGGAGVDNEYMSVNGGEMGWVSRSGACMRAWARAQLLVCGAVSILGGVRVYTVQDKTQLLFAAVAASEAAIM